MPATRFATVAPFIAALSLVLLWPVRTLTGPPDRASGKMVMDEVSEGLRRYRRETDESKRVEWLRKLARTRDPRVGAAMGEYLSSEGSPFPHQLSVVWLLTSHFMPSPVVYDDLVAQMQAARVWWRDNEAHLRRQALRLPP
jgi:hypothetical protein